MGRIGVLIVDDDQQVLRKFTQILSSFEEIEILGTASSGYEGVLEAALLHPDILLMDDDMETPQSGIRAARVLLQRFPDMKIIVLTDNEEGSVVQSAIKAGIVDYILKKAGTAEIIKTIKGVYRLSHPRQQNIADKFYRRTLHPEGVQDSLMYTLTVVSQLTPGELEIIKHIIDGKNYSQIGELRNIDIKTVHESIDRILKKFNKDCINDLVKVLTTLSITDLLDHIV